MERSNHHEFKVSFTFDSLVDRNAFMRALSGIMGSDWFKAGVFLHDEERREDEKMETQEDASCASCSHDQREALDALLRETRGSVVEVAALLELDPSTIYRKIKRCGLDLSSYKKN